MARTGVQSCACQPARALARRCLPSCKGQPPDQSQMMHWHVARYVLYVNRLNCRAERGTDLEASTIAAACCRHRQGRTRLLVGQVGCLMSSKITMFSCDLEHFSFAAAALFSPTVALGSATTAVLMLTYYIPSSSSCSVSSATAHVDSF